MPNTPRPDPQIAVILDRLVGSLSVLAVAPDASLAAEEFALGQPLASRPLDLCFGCAAITPSTYVAPGTLSLSRGLARQSASLQAVAASAFSVGGLLGSVQVLNAYAFGSVFLVPSGFGAPTVQAVLTAGGTGGVGLPLLLSQDVTQDTAFGWLRDGSLPGALPPASGSVELMRLLAVVDKFDPAAPNAARIAVRTLDLRRPRGWGGYADETMAEYLVPALVLYNDLAGATHTAASQMVITLVSTWVNLPDWAPSFLEYWRANPSLMPARLKAYLWSSLGIRI